MDNVLEVENLYKSFKGKSGHFWEGKVEVLKGLSFTIERNKITGFLGANGAGKTTFLKILFNYIGYDSGEIKFHQLMGNNFLEILSNTGYLPERPYFHQHLRGVDFLLYMGSLCNINKKEILRQISYWSPKLKIDYALKRELKYYSKGMLQRIGVLSTLVHDPKLIILDEPLSGIDPIGRKELKDIMRIVRDNGKTVFFSSHIVSDVEEVSDNVIFLKEGVIEYAGSVEKLIFDNLDDQGFLVKYLQSNNETALKKFSSIGEIDIEENRILEIKKDRKTLEEIFYISNVENNE